MQGHDVCFLDFNFGAPNAGLVFDAATAPRGLEAGGLHSYLHGRITEPQRVDLWTDSDRPSIRLRPDGSGRMVLLPGDIDGAEFAISAEMAQRCVRLLLRMEEEFEICVLNLGSGRSFSLELALAATAAPEMQRVKARWLVFHRWTRQHIIGAAGLMYGPRGLIEVGVSLGHDRQRLRESIRTIRVAINDIDSSTGLRAEQLAWLRENNRVLLELTSRYRLGRTVLAGSIPFDPMLAARERLISDADVIQRAVANGATVNAFHDLAKLLLDDGVWEAL